MSLMCLSKFKGCYTALYYKCLINYGSSTQKLKAKLLAIWKLLVHVKYTRL